MTASFYDRPTRLIVFAGLDRDPPSPGAYAFDEARPALAELERAGIPLIFCTCKTSAEVERLRVPLELDGPVIADSGGAVVIPNDYFPFPLDLDGIERKGDSLVIPIGASCSEFIATPARFPLDTDVRGRGLASPSDHEAARATGFSDNVGIAVQLLANLYRRHLERVTTVGLAYGASDADFLSTVDRPILIASPDAERLKGLVPRARMTRTQGHGGWSEAVLLMLDGQAWR